MIIGVLIVVALLIAILGGACIILLKPLGGNPGLLTTATPSTLTAQGMACSNVANYDESIPSAYQPMYVTLNQILDNFDQALNSTHPETAHSVVYATELLPADSNRGQQLLAAQTVQGVTNYLDAIQKLGVEGVTIDISFPVLTPTYPNYAQYLSFYEDVVAQARARGMKIDIESETPLLAGYPGLPFGSVSYANLSYTDYVSEDREMIQTVINDLHPDYLNIGTETDTLQLLLHYPETSTPQGWGAYIQSLVTGLNKSNTKISVGIGSWDPIGYLYATLNDSAIDTIDVHIYPVYGNYLSILTQIGQLSQEYGKPIVIDEMWLHKSTMNEGHSFTTDAQISARNMYAFWIPLDEKFLQVMSKYARDYNVVYLSPFEGTYFLAYLNYTSATANVPYANARQVAGQAAAYNLARGLISPLGCYYQELINGSIQLALSLPMVKIAAWDVSDRGLEGIENYAR